MEWVEVRGKTVETAVAAALAELGLDTAEQADIEVLQEPQRGFLGIGGQDALVRVKRRAKKKRRRRGRGTEADRAARPSGTGGRQRRTENAVPPKEKAGSGRREEDRGRRPRSVEGRARSTQHQRGPEQLVPQPVIELPPVNLEEQAAVVQGFLVGLVEAFGLEGSVETRVEGDVIYADVSGEQTEALVGPKGAILQAILELCRTIVHRRSEAGARIRLDIAGYTERRREALRIYAGRLADKVLADGGEIMLEPMNPADRKVVHDAIAEIEGVRSYSEGEDPERSVVLAPTATPSVVDNG